MHKTKAGAHRKGGQVKNTILMRTNLLVCVVIIIGFLATAVLSYQANYSASLQNIEQVSALTSEGIYYRLMSILTKPVNVSLTMANDSLLKGYLEGERANLGDGAYVHTIQEYLDTYRRKYEYDSVFLVSAESGRYYNFNGVDRVMERDNPENAWYYAMLEGGPDYSLNVDNDEVANADNEVTVFVNCKIYGDGGQVLGIVGVGLRINYLQALLKEYEDGFGGHAFLIDGTGHIEISTSHTGYEQVDLFDEYGYGDAVRDKVCSWHGDTDACSFWVEDAAVAGGKNYVVARYVPELSWHLVIERDTARMTRALQRQLFQTMLIIAGIIVAILIVITYVIRGFNRQITRLTEDRQETFRHATEQLYDNIYELNISHNCAANPSTERYFESLGVPRTTPYDKALHVIAENQIKPAHREGYIATFTPENVLQEFQKGNTHLRYEFMMRESLEEAYFWMRIDAHIYYWPEDGSVHMFTYRKNIDAEKRLELRMEARAQSDEMTGLYTKTATQQHIEQRLAEDGDGMFGFFIFDIDNFKQVNDRFGHAFGDEVIRMFADTVRQHFRKGDVIGRIGGDEFAAFLPVPDAGWAAKKAEELSRALHVAYESGGMRWEVSASIGVAVAPRDGRDFDTLYRNADAALYCTKKRGKDGYTIFGN
ncbi:sensor domain-containing diguanylate cyclase [Intestinibacillus massiliensis]|nr:sensor domain-containing diguanylate cyclase [Intestinibacillus massiliensis]